MTYVVIASYGLQDGSAMYGDLADWKVIYAGSDKQAALQAEANFKFPCEYSNLINFQEWENGALVSDEYISPSTTKPQNQ